jgi:hypothetical protein
MFVFDHIAEQRIAEAIARGEFDDLPGAGRPLSFDDDVLVPEELRLAYRMLRNAGFVPPEVGMLRDIADLERCIDTLPEGEARAAALRKLQLLRLRLERAGHCRALGAASPYLDRIVDRLADGTPGRS